ncbi:MAG: PD-(D/E)XK nuclease family protein [Alphaproteobacteria bacterium]|nr:PD-(D/E)XK nuclease family protein [Alphaproteobacteria bacterium]
MSLYRIPSFHDPLREVALYLLAAYKANPLALAQVHCFVPTRRAARRLMRLFLEHAPTPSIILPKILCLSDVQSTDFGLATQKVYSDEEALFQFVSFLTAENLIPDTVSALAWGKSLLDLIHECLLWQVSPEDALCRLLQDEHARHRQEALERLDHFLASWLTAPRPLLKKEDHALTLQSLAQRWQETPPTFPIICVGVTATCPLYRDFLKVCTRLPQADVLLTDLENHLYEGTLGPAHPAWAHSELLRVLEAKVSDVPLWPHITHNFSSPRQKDRHRFVTTIFEDTFTCQERAPAPPTGWSFLPCEHRHDEAWAISLLIRERLEDPAVRLLLVTPDEALSSLVAEILKQWQIVPDEGAGLPALETPAFTFCRRLIEAVSQDFAPLALISLLKHPLFLCGHTPASARRLARLIETTALRTPFYAANLETLIAKMQGHADAAHFLNTLQETVAPLQKALKETRADLSALFACHLHTAESLAGGNALLWQGEYKDELDEIRGTLETAMSFFPPFAGKEYPALVKSLLASRSVRRQHGVHPRVSILSPEKATHITADVVILGGLNDDQWPAKPVPDPWLSPLMRARLGLSSPAHQVGALHRFFWELASQKNVIMTRSLRVDGSIQTPARCLRRLTTALKAEGHTLPLLALPWKAWQQALIARQEVPAFLKPSPTPPLAARPQKLSVSAFSLLQKDPYLFYAEKILRLSPLIDLAPAPDARLFGVLIHDLLERFMTQSDRSLGRLLGIAKEVFAPLASFSWVYLFWWQRLEVLASWIVETAQKYAPGAALYLEKTGSAFFACHNERGFYLTAKADQLVHDPKTGTVTLTDYKTGTLPTKKEIKEGAALQLPLESLILKKGGFDVLAHDIPCTLMYWHLKAPPSQMILENTQELQEVAEEVLIRLWTYYYENQGPYEPLLTFSPNAPSEQTHFSRIQEWQHRPH